MKILKALKGLCQEESGQDLIEYALLAALIAVAAIATIGTLGSQINSEFTKVSGQLT